MLEKESGGREARTKIVQRALLRPSESWSEGKRKKKMMESSALNMYHYDLDLLTIGLAIPKNRS